MTTPQRNAHMNALHMKRVLQLKLKRLEAKLSVAMEKAGVSLNHKESLDFENIMAEEDEGIIKEYSKDSFEDIFWNQQKKSLTKKGNAKKGIRWHPLIIKWCLYLRHQSSKEYETIRDSGCIALPSQRTLRDHSNAVKAVSGYSFEVDNQLLQAANLNNSPSYHRLVGIPTSLW